MENTPVVDSATSPIKDHLHIRGEYKRVTSIRSIYLGSPPHTWRILNDDAIGALGLRITSTYVENTFKSLNSLSKKRDHLHIRGEYYGGRIRKQARSGSPPHTWRIQFAYIRRWSDDRITSTYVENTH